MLLIIFQIKRQSLSLIVFGAQIDFLYPKKTTKLSRLLFYYTFSYVVTCNWLHVELLYTMTLKISVIL